METKTRKIAEFIGSRWFFAATIVLFTGQTVWLAITSRFPMAFDETYHLGLIQFFSHRWNPIVSSQSPSTYKFGAIIQDPSWLYHYLMSFPYRLMEFFTTNPVSLVIGLRFISVALMVLNLFILRKLLRLIGLSDTLTNMILLIFTLTPIVTVLSAQISYDNLVIPLTTLSLYQTVLLVRELNQRRFNSRRFLCLISLCLLTSLVKFAFLPILVSITAMVTWKFVAYWRENRSQLLSQATDSFTQSGALARTALLLGAVLSIFLFCRFYGVNIIRYHNPVPQCNQLLRERDCEQYYNWDANHIAQEYTQAHPENAKHESIVRFTIVDWGFNMSEQLYGAIVPLKGLDYLSAPLFTTALILFVVSLVCTVISFKKNFHDHPELMMTLFASIIYLLFLLGRNYHDLRQLGLPTAINGRYFIPILAYLCSVLALGISYVVGHSSSARLTKTTLAIAVIIIFICLGGFVQYVIHVTPSYGHLSNTNSFEL